jgi:hypothetical protein
MFDELEPKFGIFPSHVTNMENYRAHITSIPICLSRLLCYHRFCNRKCSLKTQGTVAANESV